MDVVSYTSITKRDIKGEFERFIYYTIVKGRPKIYKSIVYCHNAGSFFQLLDVWKRLCKGTCHIYRYFYLGEHEPIDLIDIPDDYNPNHKIKLQLCETRSIKPVLYIQ